MLHVRHLTKTFQLALHGTMTVTPFRELSFSLGAGEFLGIVGPSGIGKSSILKCMYRTYVSTAGTIRYESNAFGAIDLAAANERQISRLRRREIGYVSQFLRVIPRIGAMDIVAERLTAIGVAGDEARRQADDMLERLRIPPPLRAAYPATFSGGEQQRVNLARAFVVGPRLLLLDEPTASLDPVTKGNVLELIREMKQQGTTMVGIFHDHDFMKQVADQVLDLSNVQEESRKEVTP